MSDDTDREFDSEDETSRQRTAVEDLRANYAEVAAAVNQWVMIPGDDLPSLLCQPENRHAILHLRKSVATVRDFALIAVEKAEQLQLIIDAMDAERAVLKAMVENKQKMIDVLKGEEHGRD
jgi:hypothetical protein